MPPTPLSVLRATSRAVGFSTQLVRDVVALPRVLVSLAEEDGPLERIADDSDSIERLSHLNIALTDIAHQLEWLDELVKEVHAINARVETLESAIGPIGDLASVVPGARRRRRRAERLEADAGPGHDAEGSVAEGGSDGVPRSLDAAGERPPED